MNAPALLFAFCSNRLPIEIQTLNFKLDSWPKKKILVEFRVCSQPSGALQFRLRETEQLARCVYTRKRKTLETHLKLWIKVELQSLNFKLWSLTLISDIHIWRNHQQLIFMFFVLFSFAPFECTSFVGCLRKGLTMPRMPSRLDDLVGRLSYRAFRWAFPNELEKMLTQKSTLASKVHLNGQLLLQSGSGIVQRAREGSWIASTIRTLTSGSFCPFSAVNNRLANRSVEITIEVSMTTYQQSSTRNNPHESPMIGVVFNVLSTAFAAAPFTDRSRPLESNARHQTFWIH